MAGFRKKEVSVPEWDNAKVIIREPSAEAWIRWQGIASPEPPKLPEGQDPQEAPELTPSERAFRTMRADVTLFIDILLDTDLQPVFTVDDTEQVEAIYGPVHSRLLKQALDLIRDADDAKAK
ncbi:phage tail assembly chaperone [Klebsiella pneumoniae]|uniref:Phage tail assembly chaperone n=4 Tax=Enterobacteriaceae TaxID=543 RepID=A0A486MUM0_KLEPN|nr:phage tail assembly chaperone [Klebsiella pneumoniae]VGL35078.1 phage tail assembly chaperone [Klebsiella pneumoniae]VTM84138.1 phage tail assembly chaperone [Klebsiella pneumoniae]